jgi:hypothetical protein
MHTIIAMFTKKQKGVKPYFPQVVEFPEERIVKFSAGLH